MATNLVPVASFTAYKNGANDRVSWARCSSWIALWKYMILLNKENISMLNVVTYRIVQS